MTPVVAIARGPGCRKSRITPATSQGTQATVAVTGKSAQEKRPPPRVNPAAARSDEARLRPARRARAQVPWKATSSLKASSASRWCWMGTARAAIWTGRSQRAKLAGRTGEETMKDRWTSVLLCAVLATLFAAGSIFMLRQPRYFAISEKVAFGQLLIKYGRPAAMAHHEEMKS